MSINCDLKAFELPKDQYLFCNRKPSKVLMNFLISELILLMFCVILYFPSYRKKNPKDRRSKKIYYRDGVDIKTLTIIFMIGTVIIILYQFYRYFIGLPSEWNSLNP